MAISLLTIFEKISLKLRMRVVTVFFRKKDRMKNLSVIAVMLFSLCNYSLTQCSDAGVCSLRERVRTNEGSSPRQSLGISYLFGRSAKSDDITYHTARLDGSFTVMEGASVSVMIPFNAQSGPLGNVSGIGDVIVVWNHTVMTSGDISASVQVGAKFATGNANGEPALPQQYQSGLGSNDFLLGATANYNAWDVTLGYQIAGGRNSSKLTRLQRNDDMLFRAGYSLIFDRFTVHPSFLFIQRLGNSSIANSSYPVGPEFVELSDSAPSQINLLTEGKYELSDIYSLHAGVALPFLKRKTNVDGLTRAITLSAGLSFLF